jgi:hypothetical protein
LPLRHNPHLAVPLLALSPPPPPLLLELSMSKLLLTPLPPGHPRVL